jgi:hypothetical protein
MNLIESLKIDLSARRVVVIDAALPQREVRRPDGL